LHVEKEDPRLCSITGDRIYTGLFGNVVDSCLAKVPLITQYQIDWNAGPARSSIVINAFLKGPFDQYRVVIDRRTMLISRIQRIKSGKVVHDIIWETVKINGKTLRADGRDVNLSACETLPAS